MKITLKNIKHARNLSEETNAFTATVYVDGKKAGDAYNRGNGGCTEATIDDKKLRAKVEAYFANLPKVHCERFNFDYQPTLDLTVDELIEEDLERKDLQALIRKGVVVIKDGGLFVYPFSKYIRGDKSPTLKQQLKVRVKNQVGGEILNDCPLKDIVSIVKKKTNYFG
jgi:hypothetical protein